MYQQKQQSDNSQYSYKPKKKVDAERTDNYGFAGTSKIYEAQFDEEQSERDDEASAIKMTEYQSKKR